MLVEEVINKGEDFEITADYIEKARTLGVKITKHGFDKSFK